MATDCIAQLRLAFEKNVVVKFDVSHASADGGAVLLKALDQQLGVTDAVASSLRDRRQPGKIQHEVVDLVRQRIFGLACGYADGNDAARLADDAVHKLLLDRDPLAGPALASQPTLSRFENAVGQEGFAFIARETLFGRCSVARLSGAGQKPHRPTVENA